MKMICQSVACIAVVATLVGGLGAQELKPDEILAKHSEAIGKPDARLALKTLMAVGISTFEADAPVVKGGGRAVIVSDKDNLFFVISLNSREYPFEKIGFFRDKPNLPYPSSGRRSLLGAFLSEHSAILSEGLFGGSMARRWPFIDGTRKPNVKSGGTKKVGDRKAYILTYYVPKASSEFSVKLYFDAENFNLLRTEYRRDVAPNSPVFGRQNQISNSLLVLTETFGDFQAVDGLTLPFSYSVEFSSNSGNMTFKNTWGIQVRQYHVNQALAPDFFTFDTK